MRTRTQYAMPTLVCLSIAASDALAQTAENAPLSKPTVLFIVCGDLNGSVEGFGGTPRRRRRTWIVSHARRRVLMTLLEGGFE